VRNPQLEYPAPNILDTAAVADGGERGQCGFIGIGEGVQVAFHCNDSGVTKPFLNHLQVGSARQQPRCVRMTQVVNTDTVF